MGASPVGTSAVFGCWEDSGSHQTWRALGSLPPLNFHRIPWTWTWPLLILSSGALWLQHVWPPTTGDPPDAAHTVPAMYQVTSMEIISHKQ